MSQNMEALGKANRVRIGRAELKRRLREDEVTLRDALDDEYAETMRVFDLLMEQWGWGPHRARRYLRALPFAAGDPSCRVSEMTVCGRLSERRKDQVAGLPVRDAAAAA